MEPPVFFGSALVVIAFVAVGGGFTELAGDAFAWTQGAITRLFGWWYMLAATVFLLFALIVAFSPMRRIRIGGPDARPDFSRLAWFAMLFAAGMGTGLVFWSVAEPLTHYAAPPMAEPRSPEALREAMRITYFHWGLNAWAIYIVLALAVAYFHFNRGLPLAPRSALHGLIGDRIHGPIGHGVDILCTVGTLLGVATSLGLGAMQVNAGAAEFLGWPQSAGVQSLIIAAITVVATISVVLGVKAGIRRLSMTNILLAFGLLGFVLLAGPTIYLLETFVASIGLYLQNLPRATLWLDFTRESDWQANWTLFYWGWWISWSPFVAIFVARISKGRTIGEMVTAVLLAPTLATFFWLAVFGGAALHLEAFEGANIAGAAQSEPATSLFALLSRLPGSGVSMLVATFVIIVFFVTSSDSGSLVDDMVTSGGDPDPPRSQRVFWAVSEGAVAATLLLVGGLQAIRNAAISLGLPMSLLLFLAAISLASALRASPELKAEKPREPGNG